MLNILDSSSNKKHSQEPLNTVIELHGELEFKTKLFKIHPRSATFAFSEQRITLTNHAECSGANYSLAVRIFACKTEALRQSTAIVFMLNTLDSSTNKKYLQEQLNMIIEVHDELEFKTVLFKVIHSRSPTLAFRITFTNNTRCSGANYSLIERIFACKSDALKNQTTRSNFSGLKNSLYYDVCDYALDKLYELIKGGGVGAYIHESINFKRRIDIEKRSPDLEHLWLEVPGRNRHSKVLIGIMYRSTPM